MNGTPGIDRLPRVLITLLILVATIMLGIGEHSANLILATLGVALASAYVADFKGYLLRQSFANWAALAVVVISAAIGYQTDRVGLISVVANLQSYLQYVLLFQPKTVRVYWQLGLLSLGQVAIASTLVPGPVFGVFLAVYVFLGIITFVLLHLHVEAARFERSPWVEGSQIIFDPAALAGARPAATTLTGKSAPLRSRAIGWGLLEQVAMIGLVALAAGASLFLALPRWTISNRQTTNSEELRSVGFSRTVTLGELGEVVNNPYLVMRVKFFRGHSDRPIKLADEPLFRGTDISRYVDGRWTQMAGTSPVSLQSESKRPFYRQQITVEPSDTEELFSVFPVFGLENDSRLRVDSISKQLLRQEDHLNEQLEFEVGTNGIADNRQREFVPCQERLEDFQIEDMMQMPPRSGPQSPLAGLRALAVRLLNERGVDPEDPRQRVAAASLLNNYLRNSGEFAYSLQPQQRDESLDPLEDFVTRHRVGHCEYFAGALVMMLRSVNIPARMAIGFKGGEWNSLGMYYQVQQLHAHTWVEVYLGQESLPDGAFDADDKLPPAAWMVLDPTGDTQESLLASQRSRWWARLRHSVDYAEVLWSNYVVGLNSQRQQMGIYGPLTRGVGTVVENATSARVWQARLRAVAASPVGTFWQWYREHWFSWRGGLVAAGFALLVLALFVAVSWLRSALRRWGPFGAGRLADSPPVLEMYRRLEEALSRHGFKRAPGQTAYEFALAAGGDLSESIEYRALAPLPRRIVEAFYRVRFGGRTLDNPEADAVEHALVELELALGKTR